MKPACLCARCEGHGPDDEPEDVGDSADMDGVEEREPPREVACGLVGLGAVKQLEERGLAVVWAAELAERDATDEETSMALASALADRDRLAARVIELQRLLSPEVGEAAE